MTHSRRMPLFNAAYLKVFLPLMHADVYEGVGRRWDRYAERERLTLRQNLDLQWQELQRLVAHAYATTPFYKRRLDEAGLQVKDLQSPADLRRLPVLTKQDIQGGFDDLWSRDYDRSQLLGAATGGTTDTPVPLLRDRDCTRERMALRLRFNAWAGLFPGDKVFWLWGARTDFPQDPSWRWKFYDRHLMRRHWAPTSLLNEQVLAQYKRELSEFRPQAIIAYPTPLALFSEYLLASGGGHHCPPTVISTAEPLTPEQRAIIEKAFGVRVFDHYGSRDFGMIAAECELHQGLHLNPAAVYIEHAPVAEGVEGVKEILVTDLLNYGMPMIRYRVNDCALPSDEACPCGRGYPLMRALEGRTTDNFYLANGDVVPGVAFTNRLIKVCPGIRKMQLVQETVNDFRIRYVPAAELKEDELTQLRNKFYEFVGGAVNLQFERVAEIEREASGKTRFAISKVRRPQAVPENAGGAR